MHVKCKYVVIIEWNILHELNFMSTITFKWNCVKLAWAFINIMNAIHHCGILHNNLSKDNIMLHFLANNLDVVYIGMCDWGEAGGLQKVTPSLYGFAKEQDAINTKKCRWVAPKLFFIYNKLRTTNSPWWMAKQHATTLRSKAYSMGRLANVIWVMIGMHNVLWTINKDVIWETYLWHVWPKSKGTKNYSTRRTHIDGASM